MKIVRRLALVVLLVGAAFAGGAVINGPGRDWLRKTWGLGRSIVVDSRSPSPAPAEARPRPFPTAKAPTLLVELDRRPNAPKPDPSPEPGPSATPDQPDPLQLPESPATPASALAPLPRPRPEPAAIEAEPAPLPPLDPVARLVSVESPAPNPVPNRDPNPNPLDWPEIRKRMKALGIARYTLDAEPDGRARFTCLIPVDGLKAIGHHFEAEGDDEMQAIEAGLKRIGLWKATSQD